jgi:hypothetical protein
MNYEKGFYRITIIISIIATIIVAIIEYNTSLKPELKLYFKIKKEYFSLKNERQKIINLLKRINKDTKITYHEIDMLSDKKFLFFANGNYVNSLDLITDSLYSNINDSLSNLGYNNLLFVGEFGSHYYFPVTKRGGPRLSIVKPKFPSIALLKYLFNILYKGILPIWLLYSFIKYVVPKYLK